MTERIVWATTVTGVSQMAREFFDQSLVVLFGDDAPEELAEISVTHRVSHSLAADEGVRPGDVIRFAGEPMAVLAVGDVANDNLRELGHLILKRNGARAPALPGDVCCDEGPIPPIDVGDDIVVVRPPVGAGANEVTS